MEIPQNDINHLYKNLMMHPCFQELWAYKIHDVVSPNTGPLAIHFVAQLGAPSSIAAMRSRTRHSMDGWCGNASTAHSILQRPWIEDRLALAEKFPVGMAAPSLSWLAAMSSKSIGCSAPVVFTRKSVGELRLQLSLVSLQVKTSVSLAKVEAQRTKCWKVL